MKIYCIILFCLNNIVFSSENYLNKTHLAYKPLTNSSLINFQIAFYESQVSSSLSNTDFLNPTFGIQWWVSENLQIAGMISVNTKGDFPNLYNNFSFGYYNQNIKWLYSSSNFIEVSLHRIKYNNNPVKWINFSYKSRYNYKNFIIGYDINHYFWKNNIQNNFISLILSYNIKNFFIIEMKSDIDANYFLNSLNFSFPL